jgi:ribosomal protein S27E
VTPLLKEKKFNIDVDSTIQFLNRYKSGRWIYPSVLKSKLKIDIKEVYAILEICVDAGLIEQYLEIYCPECKKFTGYHYKTIFDIPEEVYCLHCDEEITNPQKYAIIIYKVL